MGEEKRRGKSTEIAIHHSILFGLTERGGGGLRWLGGNDVDLGGEGTEKQQTEDRRGEYCYEIIATQQ
jgi:hypothetical protein